MKAAYGLGYLAGQQQAQRDERVLGYESRVDHARRDFKLYSYLVHATDADCAADYRRMFSRSQKCAGHAELRWLIIETARENRGWTQRKIAATVGAHYKYVHKVLREANL